jgi:hypothetical protein
MPLQSSVNALMTFSEIRAEAVISTTRECGSKKQVASNSETHKEKLD